MTQQEEFEDVETNNRADLKRMKELNAVIIVANMRDLDVDEEVYEEFSTLQARLVEAYTPLVTDMVAAGLLSVTLWRDEGDVAQYLKDEYGFVCLGADRVYVNGNINLCASEFEAHGNVSASAIWGGAVSSSD